MYGIIRGGKPAQLSTTLIEAAKYDMELKIISRKVMRKKHDEFPGWIRKEFPDHYIIPEGQLAKKVKRSI